MSRKRAAKRSAQRSMKKEGGRKDHYFHKAKKESYVARSVYKLEQMDKKHRLIGSGNRVLDLGCHPGSWMQYASRKVGSAGIVLGIDRTETQLDLPNAKAITADIYDLTPDLIGEPEKSFDVVLSDMAPNTTGIKTVDHLQSAGLAERALDLALCFLRPGGNFVVKIFMGPEEPALFLRVREHFEKAVRSKPDASRSRSTEGYLVGMGRKEAR